MRVFITGATGLVGRRLVIDRLARGDRVVVLSRDGARAGRLFAADVNPNVSVVAGDPAAPGPWQEAIDGCDAVIHLAGAGVADHRWTQRYKAVLVASRVDSTYQVVGAIRRATATPRVLVNASAVGFYGDTAGAEVDESADPGTGFLADLSVQWEGQAVRAEESGTRVVLLRTGQVLDARGGALAKMVPIFRAFAGGPLGSGRQRVPWIHWRDVVGLIDFVLDRPDASGPYNLTAPTPVTSKAFARSLGRALGRPALLPAPRLGLRLVLGEFAGAVMADSNVVPRRALEEGYEFQFTDLDAALASLLSQQQAAAAPDPPAAPAAPAPPEGGTPISLVAIDVDDTLLRPDGRLDPAVAEACRSADRMGCVVVLATSRAPREVRDVVTELGVASPVIAYNGAAIWNPMDDRPQHHQPLDAELARDVVAAVTAPGLGARAAAEVLDRRHDDVRMSDDVLAEPVTRLEIVADPDRLAVVLETLRERWWRERRIAVFTTRADTIHVTHPLVDKGIALQRIANRMGVTREQVMAIGADDNDLGMLEWAGTGVAVANACPAARDLASVVVPANDEHGAARALEQHVLNRGDRGARGGSATMAGA